MQMGQKWDNKDRYIIFSTTMTIVASSSPTGIFFVEVEKYKDLWEITSHLSYCLLQLIFYRSYISDVCT